MDFDASFFDAQPSDSADMPIAAMRALARQAKAAPMGQSFDWAAPQSGGGGGGQPLANSPLYFPKGAAAQPSEAEGLIHQAMGLAKDFSKAENDNVLAKNLRARIAALQQPALDLQATDVGQGTPGPVAYSPLHAPDTGQLDESSIPSSYYAKNRAFESTNKPDAINPGSKASGLYQFLPSTWKGLMEEAPHLGLSMEGILDTGQQERAMHYFTGKNARALKAQTGRDPTGGELYAMHLLGQSGGSRVIRNPGDKITDLIDHRAIAGNPWLRSYETGRDLMAALNRKFG